MSTSTALVRFADGTFAVAAYSNSADVLGSNLWPDLQTYEAGRRAEPWRYCRCGQPPEPCEIDNSWAYGAGTACRRCMCIVDSWCAADTEIDNWGWGPNERGPAPARPPRTDGSAPWFDEGWAAVGGGE